MGVTNHEYIILNGNKKQLKKVASFFKKELKKNEDTKPFTDCVGKIGGGMNGYYSLVIVPTGYNGGFPDELMKKLQAKIDKTKFKADKYNNKHKDEIKKRISKMKFSVSMTLIRFADWGDSVTRDDGQVVELKWAPENES